MYKFNVIPLSDMPAAGDFLTAEEFRYYESLKIEKRRNDFALGRYALKRLISENFVKTDLKNIEVLRSEPGLPVMTVNGLPPDINVSISHSNGYGAACASRDFIVGIDIEKAEPRSRAWAEFCFTEKELSAGDGAEYLTALWAKKEAAFKVLGIGLSGNLKEIEFYGNEIKFYGRTAERNNVKDLKVDVKSFKDFIIATAYAKGDSLWT